MRTWAPSAAWATRTGRRRDKGGEGAGGTALKAHPSEQGPGKAGWAQRCHEALRHRERGTGLLAGRRGRPLSSVPWLALEVAHSLDMCAVSKTLSACTSRIGLVSFDAVVAFNPFCCLSAFAHKRCSKRAPRRVEALSESGALGRLAEPHADSGEEAARAELLKDPKAPIVERVVLGGVLTAFLGPAGHHDNGEHGDVRHPQAAVEERVERVLHALAAGSRTRGRGRAGGGRRAAGVRASR